MKESLYRSENLSRNIMIKSTSKPAENINKSKWMFLKKVLGGQARNSIPPTNPSLLEGS